MEEDNLGQRPSDIDGEFEGTEEWYDLVARSRPPKDKPWYHILVDGSDQTTYVAERHLEADNTCEPVFHPDVNIFFDDFKNCSYQSRRKIKLKNLLVLRCNDSCTTRSELITNE